MNLTYAAYVSTGINFPMDLLTSPTVHYVPCTLFPFTCSRNRSQRWSVDESVIARAFTIFHEEIFNIYYF